MSVTTPRRGTADRRAARSARRDALWIDVPFLKAPAAKDGSGDIILTGYASTWNMDRDDEIIAPGAFDKSLPDYLAKNPMVLWQHNMDWPIGAITSAQTDQTGLYVSAAIPNPGENAADWQKGAYTSIANGVVRTFSIGGYFTRDVRPGPDGPVFYIIEVDLFEVSCVSIPANADSIYEAAVKALNGVRGVMPQKAHDQFEQLMAVRELTDPELLHMSPQERQHRWEELAALFERAYEIPAPPRDSFLQIAKARAAGLDVTAVQKAAHALQRTLTAPTEVAAEEKAGRAISAANREKLEGALAAHGVMQEEMVNAAQAMQRAAGAHADSQAAIKGVLGVQSDEPEPDDDPDPDEPGTPEKALAAGAKEWQGDIFARLREAGTDRFGTDDPDGNVYVYVDDFDLDRGVVVYCVYYGGGDEDYFQVAFTRAADGTILLATEASEVVPTHGYVPKSAASPAAKAAKRTLKALPTCPECGATIGDPSEGCQECGYQVPDGDAADPGDGKAYQPDAYEREGDETVACPACNLFNDSDAVYCDQCGTQLEGRTDVGGSDGSQDGEAYAPAPYREDSDDAVTCPQCQRGNAPDASYCDQCGFRLEGAEGVLRRSAPAGETKGALSLADLPIADRDTAWDSAAAKRLVHAQAKKDDGTYDPAVLRKAYLWIDDGADATKVTSYRFIVASAPGGTLTYVPKGIFAAANVVQGGRGGTSAEIASAIKPKIAALYAKLRTKFGDDSITVPWSGD